MTDSSLLMARIWEEEYNLNIFLEFLHCSLSFPQDISSIRQVCTGREFKLKAPTVIINSCHEIKETDDPEVSIYLYCILLKTTIFNERCRSTGYWPSASFSMRSSLPPYQYTWQRATKALVAVTFTTKRLLVIMFSEYTVQTMGSNTSSWLLLTLCAIALRVIIESWATRTKTRNNTSFANV